MRRAVPPRALVLLAAGVSFVGALAVPLSAYGWSFSSNVGSNLFLAREASDTATATVLVYRYGGTPSSGQWSQGSFDDTLPSTAFFYPVRSSPSATVVVEPKCRHISFSAIPSYSHLLAIIETGEKWFVGPGNSQAVYLAYPNSSTATGAIQTSVVGTVAANIASIAADTTMTVSGTLPVDPWTGFTPDSGFGGAAVAFGLLALGVALVYAAVRGFGGGVGG